MTYDDPSLREFRGYLTVKEPGWRERADAWATAIGLQKVDGLSVSRQAVQKHIVNLKAAGRLRRVGPDKGGHWEVSQ